MKKLLIIVAALVVVGAGLLIFGISNLGPIIQKGVNTYGPKITKTEVRLGDVSVSLLSGRASLKDFFLGNPKGFQSAQAIRVGSVLVDVDEKSLAGDTIVIDKIEVIGPDITYEKARGTDNFQAILKNVKEATGQSRSSRATSREAEEKGGAGKSLFIKDFLLKDGKVTLSESMLAGKRFNVALPEIHLKDLGGQGTSPAAIFEKILAALYKEMTSPAMTKAMSEEFKKLGGDFEKTGKDLQKQLESAGKGSPEDLEKTMSQVKGLFGKQRAGSPK